MTAEAVAAAIKAKSAENRGTFWRGIGVAVATPFLIAFGALAGSFPVMIALGVWHHEVNPGVPALGFWPVLGISWGAGAVISKFRAKYDFTGKKK